MNLILLTEMNLSWMYSFGLFLAIVIPFILALIIARFRGFWASLFFLPFYFGLVAFGIGFGKANTILEGWGGFGLGLQAGFLQIAEFFKTCHNQCVEMVLRYVNNETFASILRANWFMFVPYLVLFVIFFAAIHKRKKKRKDEDFF